MILLPVIERELRAAARLPFSYYLRVLGVLALLMALAFPGAKANLGPGGGGRLFGYFHYALFFAIWLLVPLLAADSISRERREGTLPLLFLTPLKPRGIVYGKGMVHGLRAFSLWLAVLPVLTICFLIGGVGWSDVLLSELVNFSSICLALAAGLAASAATRVWARALGLAMALAFLFFWALLMALPDILITVLRALSVPVPEGLWWFNSTFDFGFALALNPDSFWQDVQMNLRISPLPVIWGFVIVALLSLFCALLLGRFAAWAVSRTWQDHPLSARAVWLRDKLCKPVFFQRTLQRWLRWELQHNPIGWLEQRSWSGRLVIWSWFAIVVCAYCSLFANMPLYKDGFQAEQTVVASMLALSIALSAAGSFRRDRESGVLELLLVAPLRESQIIAGRVRGLWRQFLPASVLLCALWLYCATFLAAGGQALLVLLYMATFITLPVVGLYFSLTRGSFIAALVWTLFAQFVLPAALAQITRLLLDAWMALDDPDMLFRAGWLVSVLSQALLALFLAWRLRENLKHRKFALQSYRS